MGRTVELDQLRVALDAAWTGLAQLVLVRGEAGIGKSRLNAELAGEAKRRGGRGLPGQAHESDQALPFGLGSTSCGWCWPSSAPSWGAWPPPFAHDRVREVVGPLRPGWARRTRS